jgi:hypothetical protein
MFISNFLKYYFLLRNIDFKVVITQICFQINISGIHNKTAAYCG